MAATIRTRSLTASCQAPDGIAQMREPGGHGRDKLKTFVLNEIKPIRWRKIDAYFKTDP
jgi:hypothetical protein